jgi:ABC-type transporter Mla subunit MlaD
LPLLHQNSAKSLTTLHQNLQSATLLHQKLCSIVDTAASKLSNVEETMDSGSTVSSKQSHCVDNLETLSKSLKPFF